MIFESHSHIVKYLGWKGWTKHSVFDNFSFSSVALVCFFFDNVSQEFGAQTSFHLGSSFLNYISSLFVPVSEILITLHKSCFSIAEWTNTRWHMWRSHLEIITSLILVQQEPLQPHSFVTALRIVYQSLLLLFVVDKKKLQLITVNQLKAEAERARHAFISAHLGKRISIKVVFHSNLFFLCWVV